MKKKTLKEVRCICEYKHLPKMICNKDCLCPQHFISLTEWRKHVVEYYNKKCLTYK